MAVTGRHRSTRLELVSHSGTVTALNADACWDVLSVGDLNEPMQTTPAAAGGHDTLRVQTTLHAFGVRS